MARRFLACLLAAAAGPAVAQPVSYLPEPGFTQVHFEVRHFGTSTARGRFDKVQASVTLDPGGSAGNVSVVVDTASVSTGFGPLDAMIRGEGFLASATHPQAYFVATRMRFDGDRLAEVRGEFTLRGVSQPLSLTATRYACREDDSARQVCGGDFEATLQRSAFQAGFGLPFVGDEVKLSIAIEGMRLP